MQILSRTKPVIGLIVGFIVLVIRFGTTNCIRENPCCRVRFAIRRKCDRRCGSDWIYRFGSSSHCPVYRRFRLPLDFTLQRFIRCQLKPFSGSIYLDSTDVFKLSTKAVAKKLGILSQSPVAPEGLTVKDLVACGRYPYQNWLQQWTKEDERFVEIALETTRMKEFAERELDTLSG